MKSSRDDPPCFAAYGNEPNQDTTSKFSNQKILKRGNSAYLPKVKSSAGPLFFSKKTSRDRGFKKIP